MKGKNTVCGTVKQVCHVSCALLGTLLRVRVGPSAYYKFAFTQTRVHRYKLLLHVIIPSFAGQTLASTLNCLASFALQTP
jgi:hypothetical protein